MTVLPLMAVTACFCAVAAGADDDGFVPFVIPARASPDSLIALPAGPSIRPDGERIVVRDGHFSRGGKRIRVWGVNTCFGANFPTHADAEAVAARLAAAGINSVRFHHMDSAAFPSGIWQKGDPTRLSPEALDRLDYFIDALARRGIFANLNLHVSRTHSRALNLPDAKGLPNYDKMVDIFTPALIDAQKRYARDLLTRVNAYRKVRYADDPAVAFVEINNEDSLFMWGAESALPSLPPYYATILHDRYLAWLKARYGTTAGLRAAWGKGAEPLGNDLLGGVDPKTWRLEQHAGCAAAAEKTAAGVRVTITKADATGWHIQFNRTGVALAGGRYYTLSFRARAARPRRIDYNVGMAHPPWEMLGLSRGARLAADWQDFRAGFVAPADEKDARVNFALGGDPAEVELADVRLRPGGRTGLSDAESLESGPVALFAQSETDARMSDRWRFLAETEKAYFDGMYAFIKKDLGCKALVTGTIVFGPCGLWAQSGMDYIDGHAYWQHPHFPGRAWDPDNWTVEQKAMVDHPGQSPLFGLAAQRLEGKPYTVSEYNHPAPNDYQAECVPMIASFAAVQDWDGVWLFAYSHRADAWDAQHYSSFFDIAANPAKWAFVPAGALIFREARLEPAAKRRVVSLSRSKDILADLVGLHIRHGRDMERAIIQWETADGKPFPDGLLDFSPHVLAMTSMQAAVALEGHSRTVQVWKGYDITDGLFLGTVWLRAEEGERGWFQALGAKCEVRVAPPNPTGGEKVNLRILKPAFSVLASAPLDEKRVLITACGRCENTDMGFSKDRRTVGRNWGRPPVRIEPVSATLSMGEDGWQCQALGPDGRAAAEVPLDGGFNLSPKYKTMWYLLTRK